MDAFVKPRAFTGIPVVDADTHLAEPYDLWTSRAPAKFRDRVPQVKEKDGRLVWVMDHDKVMGPAFPTCTIRHDGSKAFSMEMVNWTFEDAYPASHEPKARLAYMDQNGIAAQIAYPNLLGFGNQKGMGVDPELRLVITKIYNDMLAEFQAATDNRVYGMIMLPWWDMKECLAEAERCRLMGMRGVNTHSEPHNNGLPVLADEHWTPLWEWCQGHDIPVNFHIGGGFSNTEWFGQGYWPTQTATEKLAFGSTMMFFSNYKLFANIFMSLWLERFPKLKIVSVESGIGWIPFFLESIEYQMHEAGVKWNVPPRELFRRQIYGCSWFERNRLVEDARYVGIDNVMFQTDFPHPVCLHPDALDYMTRAADAFTEEERRKVFGGNAQKVYNLDLSAVTG
ncbi:amidohydrolase family protein [Novosphingobium bradum]|uniref:Amidohydrolase family protein n=1 Tax=Novosphingobium bradum TaxID=1737444 RepID=A0ABV7INV8_9SPHN